MDKILVSACLLGERVRYDGGGNRAKHNFITTWLDEGRFVPVCPEVIGGLPTPRPPAEIQSGTGADVLEGNAIIKTVSGEDVTDAFVIGAEKALRIAQSYQCRYALLAARSPSCGNELIYDGRFAGQLVSGAGTTATLLKKRGILVFNENQIEELAQHLD